MTVTRFLWNLFKFVWFALLTFLVGHAIILMVWHALIDYVGH